MCVCKNNEEYQGDGPVRGKYFKNFLCWGGDGRFNFEYSTLNFKNLTH